jgi:hypothetical protein
MHAITSFSGSAVPQKELGSILADYLTLDHARIVRRLLTIRCGALAIIAGVIGTVVHGFSWAARTGSVALFLVPPVWAWIVERRVALRLSRRLGGVDGVVTRRFDGGATDPSAI